MTVVQASHTANPRCGFRGSLRSQRKGTIDAPHPGSTFAPAAPRPSPPAHIPPGQFGIPNQRASDPNSTPAASTGASGRRNPPGLGDDDVRQRPHEKSLRGCCPSHGRGEGEGGGGTQGVCSTQTQMSRSPMRWGAKLIGMAVLRPCAAMLICLVTRVSMKACHRRSVPTICKESTGQPRHFDYIGFQKKSLLAQSL